MAVKLAVLFLALANFGTPPADARPKPDSSSEEKQTLPLPPSKYRSTTAKPAVTPYTQSDSDEYYEPANYAFSYRVRAEGAAPSSSHNAGSAGSGSDSIESGNNEQRGKSSALYSGSASKSARSAEFGHAEAREYSKTQGKYYVELPDGRLQTVEYYVDGGSGYLAKVSYSGIGSRGSTVAVKSSGEA